MEKCHQIKRIGQMYTKITIKEKKQKILRNFLTLRCLCPCIHSHGTLRIEGKLENADFPAVEKHPIILTSRHPLISIGSASLSPGECSLRRAVHFIAVSEELLDYQRFVFFATLFSKMQRLHHSKSPPHSPADGRFAHC